VFRLIVRLGFGVLIVVLILMVGLAMGTETGRYLVRAAWEEGTILAHRRPIPDVISDARTDAIARAKLRVVRAARDFAADSLGLRAKQSFTTYTRLGRDTLVLVLSAAYRDRLRAYTWWFPIVGRVPYKGYFDFPAAVRAGDDLRARGYDAYVRPSPAFSTLGFFNDPVLSTSLAADSVDIANTVIHELTHNTFYAPGQAVFNESFANFVGSRGAEGFFRSRGATAAAHQAAARWEDEKVLGRFWNRVFGSLDSAFRAHPTDSLERLAARDTLFTRARALLRDSIGPMLATYPRWWVERARIDNAALLARRIYLTDLDQFDSVYAQSGDTLAVAVRRIIALARAHPHDPFAALRGARKLRP
jgi:predicted aminopeptidase